ncbi:MAG: sigma-54-dependent transcriptional regulator [Phycisphaerales bacterium]
MAKILVVEDETNLRYSIRQALSRAGHDALESASAHGAWEELKKADFDAVITDVNLGGEDGIDLVRRLRDDAFEGSIVVITGFGTVESAVVAMKLGADDYLQKPISLEELVLLIDRILDNRRIRTRLNLYQRMESVRERDSGIVGKSPAWLETLRISERMAQAPLRRGASLPTILILGETGTGKGLIARYIHQCGHRQPPPPANASPTKPDAAPFIHVNCSALPPSLVESELFGHEKGAFTDAKSHRAGLFEMAEGGTIFLDEIGDMPLDLQAKILTVVEDGIFRRVGGSRDKTVTARIIAATNQPLEARVDKGLFRRDLLYRLNALTVRIPPLRERGEDAVLIAEAMLERFSREYGRVAPRMSETCRAAVVAYAWPGNVRELINMAQRVAMLSDADEVEPEDMGLPAPPAARDDQPVDGAQPTPPSTDSLTFDFDRGVFRADDVERELIVQALRKTKGNVTRAAKLIGMQRSSFRYRIERFGLSSLVQEIAQQ